MAIDSEKREAMLEPKMDELDMESLLKDEQAVNWKLVGVVCVLLIALVIPTAWAAGMMAALGGLTAAVMTIGLSIILRLVPGSIWTRIGAVSAWWLLCLALYCVVFYVYESPCVKKDTAKLVAYCSDANNVGTLSAFFQLRDALFGP
jgi:hypothetical protein